MVKAHFLSSRVINAMSADGVRMPWQMMRFMTPGLLIVQLIRPRNV